MDRRQFVTTAMVSATAALAGCLSSGDTISTELEDGDSESFEASDGDEFEATIEVLDGDEVDVQVRYDTDRSIEEIDDEESAMGAMGGTMQGPVLSETVDDEASEEFDVSADGYYEVSVDGGTADVTID